MSDYVAQTNKLDEWVDRVAIPGMTKLGDKVSKKFQEVTKR